jgi:hypothetical protein
MCFACLDDVITGTVRKLSSSLSEMTVVSGPLPTDNGLLKSEEKHLLALFKPLRFRGYLS